MIGGPGIAGEEAEGHGGLWKGEGVRGEGGGRVRKGGG